MPWGTPSPAFSQQRRLWPAAAPFYPQGDKLPSCRYVGPGHPVLSRDPVRPGSPAPLPGTPLLSGGFHLPGGPDWALGPGATNVLLFLQIPAEPLPAPQTFLGAGVNGEADRW